MSSLVATGLLFLLLNIGGVEPKMEECCKEKRVGPVFYSLLPDDQSYSRELFFFFVSFFLLLLHFAARRPSTLLLHQGAALFFIFLLLLAFLSILCCPTTTINFTLISGSCRINVSTAASTQSRAHQALSFAFRQVLPAFFLQILCTWQLQLQYWAFYFSADVFLCIIVVHSILRGSSNRVPI